MLFVIASWVVGAFTLLGWIVGAILLRGMLNSKLPVQGIASVSESLARGWQLRYIAL